MSDPYTVIDPEDEIEAAEIAEDQSLREAEAFGSAFLQNPLIGDAVFRVPAEDERAAIERLIEGERTGDADARREALTTILAARWFQTYAHAAVARIERAVNERGQQDY